MSRHLRPRGQGRPFVRILFCHAAAVTMVLVMAAIESRLARARNQGVNSNRLSSSGGLEFPLKIIVSDSAMEACSAIAPRLYCLNQDHFPLEVTWSRWATSSERALQNAREN